MIPCLLECRGRCKTITLHTSKTRGHAACTVCGKPRRESTSALDGNETMALTYAEKQSRGETPSWAIQCRGRGSNPGLRR